MARRDFPLNIDRRRLLTSAAAAVTATGIVPGLEGAEAVAPDLYQSSALTLKAEPRNFCAATARRLLEIARRNEIRREAKLPLLPIAKELRRMKKQERTGGVRAVRGGSWQGCVGSGAEASSRGGG